MKFVSSDFAFGKLVTLEETQRLCRLSDELAENLFREQVRKLIEELFDLANLDTTFTSQYKFCVTLCELYNEHTRDLLLEVNEKARGRVVLVQMLNQARSKGKDIQDLKFEIEVIAKEINDKYGDKKSGYMPILCVNGHVLTQEKAAYYAISECCI
ncbi:hypothetical protein RYX36_005580 [Vicia faba]